MSNSKIIICSNNYYYFSMRIYMISLIKIWKIYKIKENVSRNHLYKQSVDV